MEAILAYKSKNGMLYSSKEECQRHDDIFEENKLMNKVFDIFLEMICKPGHSGGYRLSQGHGITPGYAAEVLKRHWKEVRQKLNEVDL